MRVLFSSTMRGPPCVLPPPAAATAGQCSPPRASPSAMAYWLTWATTPRTKIIIGSTCTCSCLGPLPSTTSSSSGCHTRRRGRATLHTHTRAYIHTQTHTHTITDRRTQRHTRVPGDTRETSSVVTTPGFRRRAAPVPPRLLSEVARAGRAPRDNERKGADGEFLVGLRRRADC